MTPYTLRARVGRLLMSRVGFVVWGWERTGGVRTAGSGLVFDSDGRSWRRRTLGRKNGPGVR